MFFNVDFIERTVISILETKYPCDIIFLENPSKYSDNIKLLAKKYNIYKHFICNENIEGSVFHIFCNLYNTLGSTLSLTNAILKQITNLNNLPELIKYKDFLVY